MKDEEKVAQIFAADGIADYGQDLWSMSAAGLHLAQEILTTVAREKGLPLP